MTSDLKNQFLMVVGTKKSIASVLLSATLMGMQAVFAQEINCRDGDIDVDNDGLIELCFLDDIDAVRYVLDGSGYKPSAEAQTTSSGCPATGCKGYELTRDLDFNTDASYRSTANKIKWTTTSTGGWLPIGDNDNRFSGTFDGNGYTLSNLTIHTTSGDYIGLFGRISSSGTITGISLSDMAVRGDTRVGGLVGWNDGTVSNSDSSGRVSGRAQVGGLAGVSFVSGTIRNSHSSSSVSGTSINIGGLVGWNSRTISNSYSRGSVSGLNNVGSLVGVNVTGSAIHNSGSSGSVNGNRFVGGLVGFNQATISNSYSSGSVNGMSEVGGLAGRSSGAISHSYSRGPVRGSSIVVGGLVGNNATGGAISHSDSSGSVNGNRYVGGLVGVNFSTISNSDSSGSVIGDNNVGGLVGDNHAFINSSYSRSSVNGARFRTGGLVGWNGSAGKIFNSYSSGTVAGDSSDVGGLVGTNSGIVSNSYSKAQVSGLADKVGGLVGNQLSGTISNSYSTSLATGRDEIGGLVGAHVDGTISNSYSTGLVTGRNDVGGLVGRDASSTTVSNSYWDITASGLSASAGGEGKTTAMLQDPIAAIGIYSEWSEADWDFGTAKHYPAIKYTTGTDASNPACGALFSLQPECGSLLAGQKRIRVLISTATLVHTTVLEDDIVVLEAAPHHSIFNAIQVEGNSLAIGTINPSKRWFLVPPDFVVKEATRTMLAFQVAVHDGVDTHQTTVSVVVMKVNNGHGVVSISQDGNDLTVPMASSLLDPDGGTDVSSISYQWQKCLAGEGCLDEAGWSDSGVTTRLYSVAADEARRNNRFRVIIRYRDRQGYAEEVIESITYSIRSVSLAPTFTGTDWSEFEGGAVAVCDDADIDNDDDGLIEVCHLEDLNAIRHALDGFGYQPYSDAVKSTKGCAEGGCNGYELVRDLDFKSDDSYLSTANQVRWTTGSGWLPIRAGFHGTFDGNGYTLSGLMIDRASNVGLFSYISEAVIRRIGLLDMDVRGTDKVGGLVGDNNGTISNSYSSGIVRATNEVGGLVGRGSGGTISNSYSSSSVHGNRYVGGLVGGDAHGAIHNSYNSGSVRAAHEVGGLVGQTLSGMISSSYNSGSVVGNHRWTGGLVGTNRGGTIRNSYNSGSVHGMNEVGGLVGWNNGTVSNSYSSSLASGYHTRVGGLVGWNGGGTVTDSYWDIVASRLLTSYGGTSQTTTALQGPTRPTGIYLAWSSLVWDFGTAIQYPAIKYTPGADANNPACGTVGQPRCGSLLAGQRTRQITISTQTYVHAEAVEGETVVLNATPGNFTYQWSQTDGRNLSLTKTNAAELRFFAPNDLVRAEAVKTTLTFGLTISTTTTVRQQTTVHLVVAKIDNGLMSQPTISRDKNSLVPILGTDPDGVATIEEYQWQRCLDSITAVVCSVWREVSSNASYSIPKEHAVVGNRFRVRLTYTDGQAYRASVTSAVFTYQKPEATFLRLKLFLEGALQ